ncbi:Tautomerase/MIF superfamily protein [Prunus dulcis]|uniref:Tautomerase/MIF superfamily protein n=1 Tax=Prunus dulcis TaxID=3755 RepID=A0A4Y1RZQ0_PRUDU|nr:Tautomerase/MIF superfamily protein [Prunus dulcis]
MRMRGVPYKAHHPLSVWSMWDLTIGGLLGAHWLRVRRNYEVKRVGGWSNPRMGDPPGKLLRELPGTNP